MQCTLFAKYMHGAIKISTKTSVNYKVNNNKRYVKIN